MEDNSGYEGFAGFGSFEEAKSMFEGVSFEPFNPTISYEEIVLAPKSFDGSTGIYLMSADGKGIIPLGLY